MMEISECTKLVTPGPFIGGNIEDYYYFYIPKSIKGVFVVDERIGEILQRCSEAISPLEHSSITGLPVDMLVEDFGTMFKNGMLVSPNDTTKNAAKTDRLQCWMHVTNKCNLECDYCYIHKNSDDMSFKTATEAVDRMLASCKEHNYHNLGIRFSGGEPLIRLEMLKQVVNYANNKCGDIKLHFSIITNGTLISEQTAFYLKENKFVVAVSMDGPEAYHDKHRHDKNGHGSYKNAVSGIETLIKAHIEPEILVTITQESMYGLPELTKELVRKKRRFRFSLERDTGDVNASVLSTGNELTDILGECIDIMENAVLGGNTDFIFQFIDVHFDNIRPRSCAAGTSFFAIRHDGMLGTCGMGLQEPYGKLWESTDLISDLRRCNALLDSLCTDKISACNVCIWKHSCAGGCPLLTKSVYGTYTHPSPFCKIYKEVLPKVLYLHALRMLYNYKKGKEERL